jgi:hypothetical protein
MSVIKKVHHIDLRRRAAIYIKLYCIQDGQFLNGQFAPSLETCTSLLTQITPVFWF